MNCKDLTGCVFGKLSIISYFGPLRPEHPKNKQHAWNCLCECGNSKVIKAHYLTSGNIKSCGCSQGWYRDRIDLSGSIYGKWTVIRRGEKDYYWLCRCECGVEKEVFHGSLRSGKSSFCKTKWRHKEFIGYAYKKNRFETKPETKLQHNISGSIRQAIKKNNSKKKGSILKHLPYTIAELREHLESQFEDWMSWENYGGCNSSKEKTWHIDHIVPQSHLLYLNMEDENFKKCWALDNLRPLEKIANIKKGNTV